MYSTSIPIICIVGPTGIGKTRLSIKLAKALGGEVISVDSLQVYQHAGIMTARVTAKEMDGVTHHLVNYLDAAEEPNTFIESALRSIKEIQARGMIPLLCGGSISLTSPLLLHPSLTYQKRHVIAMTSSMATLGNLLDSRVDQMCQEGLLQEVQQLHQLEKELLAGSDCSRGIWKAIGYRELRPWADTDGPRDHLLKTGLCAIKESTKAYAGKQLVWMMVELLKALKKQNIDVRILRLYDPSRFEHEVEVHALKQCNDWLFGHFSNLLDPSPMILTEMSGGLIPGKERV